MSIADPLHDAIAIEDPYQRALAIAQASEQVPEDEKDEVLTQGLRAAYQVDDPRKQVEAMMAIAARLGRPRGGEIAREALQRASKADDPEWLAAFLREVAPRVPEEARETARNIAQNIGDEKVRREVMVALGPGVVPERATEPSPETVIVRIDAPDGTAVGAGVLIAPDVVLTATHVVLRAAGLPHDAELPRERDPVRVQLPFASSAATGQVEKWVPEERLAIATLRLTSVVPGARPARLVAPRREGAVRAFGFPRGYREGLWVTARIVGSTPDGRVQLEGGKFEPGFGGAPAWDHDTGEVVGLVHSIATDRASAILTPGPLLLEGLGGAETSDHVSEPASAEDATAADTDATTTAASATGTPPSAFTSGDRWTLDDRLDYALYAKAIAEFIRHPDATPPMVISVQAPWGQGKTSLMRMVQANLDPDHPELLHASKRNGASATIEPPSELTFGELRDSLDGTKEIDAPERTAIRTVWFNAWKYQSSEQIWAGLAHAILAQLPARLPAKERELFWLRLQLRRIDPSAVRSDIHRAALERFLPRLASWVVLALGVVIVAGLTLLAGGLDAIGAAVAGGGVLAGAGVARRAWTAATKEALERPLEGAYLRWVRQPDYESRLGYLHLVEEDMVRALDLLTPDNQPVVIFIDDLDRCSPEKVGEVLEAVNLFLAGDYPNCAFVIGIDAEVVAASMEVVHEEIIRKLNDRRGELGWRFMDKFVQLPFVMPRLDPNQRKAYLKGLMWTPPPEEAKQLVAEADKLSREIREDALEVDESAKQVGELARKLAAVAPERARALGEQVVSAGARAFSDDDPEVSQALEAQLRYLSDNPRTIKRAVNLYRFHRFAAFARQASTLELEVATTEQIGRWVVAIIRWPHFVRWLQAQRGDGESGAEDAATRVLTLAREAETLEAFTKALGDAGIEASWTDERELWEFLREPTRPQLELHLAGARGLW